MTDLLNSFEQLPTGSNKNNGKSSKSPSDNAAVVALWRVRALWSLGGLLAFVLAFMSLAMSVALGTTIGNGVPMARTAEQAFRQGMQTGLSNCPCNKNRPQVVNKLVPKPETNEVNKAVKVATERVIKPVSTQDAVISPTPLDPGHVFRDVQ